MFGRRSGVNGAEGIPSTTKTKVAPTKYPRLIFHGLRTVQLISAIIVGGIMYYFDYNLTHDSLAIPWTFIFLSASSALTILTLLATIILHLFFGLNPRLNLVLNGVLFALWGAGFGLLTWWSRMTLAGVCSVERWTDEDGVMICRCYKALFTFAMTGLVSTIAALVLDIWVFRRATARGKYNQMDDQLDSKGAFNAQYGDHDDEGEELGHYNRSANVSALHLNDPFRDSNHSSVDVSTSAGAQRTGRLVSYPESTLKGHTEGKGYNVPEEQFSHDTSYQGAQGQRVFS